MKYEFSEQHKTVLITGCSGLVGTYLIKKFLKENFIVVGVDLKPIQFKISYEYEDNFRYECLDLTADNNIRDVINRHKPDVVVNAFGVKGSPIRAKESPVDFLYPSFKINTEFPFIVHTFLVFDNFQIDLFLYIYLLIYLCLLFFYFLIFFL